MNIVLSSLPKTWIIDIDGVIFEHNGYKELKDGEYEKPLGGVKEFFSNIPKNDFVILVTSREEKYRFMTEESLKMNGIRYDIILMGLPVGERILINDKKPSGLKTAYAINLKRNKGLVKINVGVDKEK